MRLLRNPMRARRQDNVRSVVLDLHHVSSAVAELHVQGVAIIASLTLQICRRHAYLPSSLLSLTAACARTSAAVAAGSPQ
jgi:hypothetical protein